ncbi:MAG: class I SAM-dependent methyltransferase [Candidatus Omnitrophica bacterium]|nr:class I SAM-dependent methyltransferase [Candidatus Omnitrophota bacterium]
MVQTPNRAIMAFQPVVFHQYGYPARVRMGAELFKYIDVMHDLRFEEDFHQLLGGLTREEFDLLQRLTTLICRFSEARFGRKALARSSVLRHLYVLRHIRYLSGGRPLRVLEIGPGCGYLGAMLMLEGYSYAAMDVTQAFYLYQNWFWNFISDGQVTELARDSGLAPREMTAPQPGGILHVPWWEFVRSALRSGAPFDLVVCNHALCEMHRDSLAFILKSARRLLDAQDGRPKAFVLEGWGARYISLSEATKSFYRAGFTMVHNDGGIIVFAPTGTSWATNGLRLPHHTPLKRRYVRGVRRLLRRGINVVRRAMWESPLPDMSYEPCEYRASGNPFSRAIHEGRSAERGTKTVGLEQVNRFYTELLGSENHLNPDERFLTELRP